MIVWFLGWMATPFILSLVTQVRNWCKLCELHEAWAHQGIAVGVPSQPLWTTIATCTLQGFPALEPPFIQWRTSWVVLGTRLGPCPIDHFRFPDVGLQRNFGNPSPFPKPTWLPWGFRRLQYFPQKRLVSGLRCNSLGLTENTWFPALVSKIIDSRLSQSFQGAIWSLQKGFTGWFATMDC